MTLSSTSAAWRCMSAVTCEYRFIVIAMSACPSRSCTTLGCTPCPSRSVAHVCRRSWNRIVGTSAAAISLRNRIARLLGCSGGVGEHRDDLRFQAGGVEGVDPRAHPRERQIRPVVVHERCGRIGIAGCPRHIRPGAQSRGASAWSSTPDEIYPRECLIVRFSLLLYIMEVRSPSTNGLSYLLRNR
jgi:hypothetical protein